MGPLVFGNDVQRKETLLYFESMSLKAKQRVRNLGVLFDCDLSLNSEINNVCKTAYDHLSNFTTSLEYAVIC